MIQKRRRRISGGSINNNLDSIDKHLDILYKRSGKYIIGSLPPVPVFDYVTEPEQETGVVLRRLFPGPGKVTKGALFIEEYLDKGDITIRVEVNGPLGGSHVDFPTRQQMVTIQPNLPVDAGFRIKVSIDPFDKVKGVWTSFLFEVGWRQCKNEKFLLDELLALQEQNDAEEDGEEAQATGQEEGAEGQAG